MNKNTRILLEAILEEKEHQDAWLYSYNHHFKKSPQEVIDEGNEQEVFDYLHWAVFGPY